MSRIVRCIRCGDEHEDTLGDSICVDCRKPTDRTHNCAESITCQCDVTALEPNEDCPIHGYPYPPRCGECGRFLKKNIL